jgi:hypothetical protein
MFAEPFSFFDWRISHAKYWREIAKILGPLALGAAKNPSRVVGGKYRGRAE